MTNVSDSRVSDSRIGHVWNEVLDEVKRQVWDLAWDQVREKISKPQVIHQVARQIERQITHDLGDAWFSSSESCRTLWPRHLLGPSLM